VLSVSKSPHIIQPCSDLPGDDKDPNRKKNDKTEGEGDADGEKDSEYETDEEEDENQIKLAELMADLNLEDEQ